MRKLLLILLLGGCSFVSSAQNLFTYCPTDGVIPVNNGPCEVILNSTTIKNPTIAPNVVNLTWWIDGMTKANSPITGINYIPDNQVLNAGPNYILFVATSSTGGQQTCTFKRGVLEFVKPVITCPKDTVQYVGATNRFKVMTVNNPVTTDNCKVAWLKWQRTGASNDMSRDSGYFVLSKQTFFKGVTTVKYTVTDAATNAASCTFKVTILDTVKPVLRCGGNVTANADSLVCSKRIALANPTYSDNCGIANLRWTMTGATVASSVDRISTVGTYTFNKGVTTITYIAKDSSGNSATCSSTVTVSDKTKPAFLNTAIKDTLKAFITSGCTAAITVPNPNAWDGCGGVFKYRWSISGATTGRGTGLVGTYNFGIGLSYITDTVWDESGNFQKFISVVRVTDTIKPTITCPASRVDTITTCSKILTISAPVYGDNCNSNMTMTWKMSGATLDSSVGTGVNILRSRTFNLGVTNCVYLLKDKSGNSASCLFPVKVVETVKPTIVCGQDMLITSSKCRESVLVNPPTFSDNCAATVLRFTASGATSFSSPGVGINYVGTAIVNRGVTNFTYRVIDASGNFATCIQKVTFIGTTVCKTFARESASSTDEGILNASLISNPAKLGFNLRLQSANSEPIDVIVYSQDGRKVEQFRTRNSQVFTFGEKYNKGSYYIVVRQGNTQKSVTGLKM